jgi:oligopeptide/dipeptide ABC transporter ATP-binding protein
MYGGKLAEIGPTNAVFEDPFHPYTMGLKNAFPTMKSASEDMISIPGSPPELIDMDDQCPFVDRCPFASDECRRVTPPLEEFQTDHTAACLRVDEVGAVTMRKRAGTREAWMENSESDATELETRDTSNR